MIQGNNKIISTYKHLIPLDYPFKFQWAQQAYGEIHDFIGELFSSIINAIPCTGTPAIPMMINIKHMLPPVDLPTLVETASKRVYEIDNCPSIDYIFPIVSTNIYEELQSIAILDMVQQKIELAEDKVAFNHNKNIFF